MPFTASVSASQNISGSPLVITDDSDYTVENKGTFSSRLLYLYLADGTTMNADGEIDDTPTAIPFSFASYPGDSISIPLTQDYGFTVVLALTSTNPQAGSTYTVSVVIGLYAFLAAFAAQKQQGTQAQMALENDKNYKENLGNLYMEIFNIQNSTSYSVLSSIQNAIDRANYRYVNNPNAF
jgi:hypothetical protein